MRKKYETMEGEKESRHELGSKTIDLRPYLPTAGRDFRPQIVADSTLREEEEIESEGPSAETRTGRSGV